MAGRDREDGLTLEKLLGRVGPEFEGHAELVASALGSDDVEEILEFVTVREDLSELDEAGMETGMVDKLFNYIRDAKSPPSQQQQLQVEDEERAQADFVGSTADPTAVSQAPAEEVSRRVWAKADQQKEQGELERQNHTAEADHMKELEAMKQEQKRLEEEREQKRMEEAEEEEKAKRRQEEEQKPSLEEMKLRQQEAMRAEVRQRVQEEERREQLEREEQARQKEERRRMQEKEKADLRRRADDHLRKQEQEDAERRRALVEEAAQEKFRQAEEEWANWQSKLAKMTSCGSQMPKVGDVVYGTMREIVLNDNSGKADNWVLHEKEAATIVQVDADGDFKLRNPLGEVSGFTYAKDYVFARPQQPAASKPRRAAETSPTRHEQSELDPHVSISFAIDSRSTSAASQPKKRSAKARDIEELQQEVAHLDANAHTHPGVVVETARARLNLAAALCDAARPLEALELVKEAQRFLGKVLEWAEEFRDDPDASSVAEQARALECAARMAEGMVVEPLGEDAEWCVPASEPSSPTESVSPAQRIYQQASRLAGDRLPPSHPLASLAVSLAITKGGRRARRPNPAVTANQRGTVPASSSRSGPPQSAAEDTDQAAAEESHKLSEDSVKLPPIGQPKAQQSKSSPSLHSAGKKSMPSGTSGSAKKSGIRLKRAPTRNHDIFKQYVQDKEDEMKARMSALRDDTDERLNRLTQKTHQTNIEVLFMEKAEMSKQFDSIYELRYTRQVHAMVMKDFERDNATRSQPELLKQASKTGQPPEAFHVKLLAQKLPQPKVKTPEPVRTKQEVVANQFASLGLGGILKR